MKENKTEQIRESELQDEFMAFWDEYKDKVGLGNYSDEVTRFWLSKLSEQRLSILEEVEKTKDRFHCGACDGGKCGHTQCCTALDTVISLIEKR